MKISVAFIRKGIDWDTTTTTGNNYITKKKVYLTAPLMIKVCEMSFGVLRKSEIVAKI